MAEEEARASRPDEESVPGPHLFSHRSSVFSASAVAMATAAECSSAAPLGKSLSVSLNVENLLRTPNEPSIVITSDAASAASENDRKLHEYRRRASKCAEQLDGDDEMPDDDEEDEDDASAANSDEEHTETTEFQLQVPSEMEHLRQPYPDFQPVVFRFLQQTTHPRDWCLRAVNWKWFEHCSIVAILINCVTLGMYSPCEDYPECSSVRCYILETLDHFIFGFFALEMVVKLIAFGIRSTKTSYITYQGYFTDKWNRLDFLIVVFGAIEYAFDKHLNLTAVRTVRVLRPLRAINRIPSLRILVTLLLDTLPMLGNVLLLCFFVFFIFGIMGVQLWSSVLRNRCKMNISAVPHEYAEELNRRNLRIYYAPEDPHKDFICSRPEHDGMQHCDEVPPYQDRELGIKCNWTFEQATAHRLAALRATAATTASTSTTMPFGYSTSAPYQNVTIGCINWHHYYSECNITDKNPFLGAISFDNIGFAWVAIFQVISMEAWVDILYSLQDAFSYWSFVYFVTLIVIGSFFMINLCLVVIATQFSETKKRETERMRLERIQMMGSTSLTSITDTSFYREVIKLITEGCNYAIKFVCRHVIYRIPWFRKAPVSRSSACHCDCHCTVSSPVTNSRGHQRIEIKVSNGDQMSETLTVTKTHDGNDHWHVPQASPEYSEVDVFGSPRSTARYNNSSCQPGCQSHSAVNSPDHTNSNANDTTCVSSDRKQPADETEHGEAALHCVPLHDRAVKGSRTRARGRRRRKHSIVHHVRRKIRKFVTHKYVQRGVLTAIMINTFAMGIEHYDQPDWLTCILEYVNLFFTSLFAVEMVLKVTAFGFLGYINNPFNMFDGFIVILSVFDVGQGGTSGLSVLRSFRLMRIFKLIRFMPALRRQLIVMLKTLDSVATFFILLGLFIFIFSVLGMNVFGCKFCEERYDGVKHCERKNFDSLLWSIITVFQVLTQEDWNVVLYVGMARTSAWASLYFVALMTFGNYVLFNLLVAILVQGFTEVRSAKGSSTTSQTDVSTEYSPSVNTIASSRDSRNCSTLVSPESRRCVHCRCYLHNTELTVRITSAAHSSVDKSRTNSVQSGQLRPPVITHTLASPVRDDVTAGPGPIRDDMAICSKRVDPSSLTDSNRALDDSVLDRKSSLVETLLRLAASHITPFVPACYLSIETIDKSIASRPASRKSSVWFSPSRRSASRSPARHTPVRRLIYDRGEKSLLKQAVSQSSPVRNATANAARHTPTQSAEGTPKKEVIRSLQNGHLVGGLSPTRLRYAKSLRDRSEDRGDSMSGSRASLRKTRDDSTVYANANYLHPSMCLHSSFRVSRRAAQSPSIGRVGSLTRVNQQPQPTPTLNLVPPLSAPPIMLIPKTQTQPPSPPTITNHATNAANTTVPDGTATDAAKGLTCLSDDGDTCSIPSYFFGSRSSYEKTNGSPLISMKFEVEDRDRDCDRNPEEEDGDQRDSECECEEEDADKVFEGLDQLEEEDPAAVNELGFDWRSYLPPLRGVFEERREYSLFLFSPENRLRRFCIFLADSRRFDNVVLIFIVLSSVSLGAENPKIDPHGLLRKVLTVSNYVFTVVFAIEMFIKVLARGLFIGTKPYMASPWNRMDFILVVISIVDLIITLTSSGGSRRILGLLRTFRLLRTLRPLRVINRAPGLKLVVSTLLSSLRQIGNIVVICCTFFIIFGVLGVQLFKGSFFFCRGKNLEKVTNKTDCLSRPGNEWVNQVYNFDNLGQSLMTLFVLSSRDGWMQIMYHGIDAVGIDMQPVENYNEWRILYFISFLLFVGFFVLNMFVGVVVENFHKCRAIQAQEEKERRLRKRIIRLQERKQRLHDRPYWMDYPEWRLAMHNIVINKYFDLLIAGVIGLNIITMAMEFYMMPNELRITLNVLNYFFTSMFTIEAILKIISLSVVRFFKDRWNQLDIVICALSIGGIILEDLQYNLIPVNPTIIRVFRVLRIARILKLLKMAKGIRELLDTVMQALPQIGNLALLFFLLFFIFASLGVELFGRLECSDEFPCVGMGKHANFETFGTAFLTLFRIATGDNWNGIMKDTLRLECDKSEDCQRNCCVSDLAPAIFFVIFVLMAQFVLVNVVVAVLMRHLEDAHKIMNDHELLNDDQLDTELRVQLRELIYELKHPKTNTTKSLARAAVKFVPDMGGNGENGGNSGNSGKQLNDATVT